MAAPRVTIGIPTFNRSAYLADAVRSALRQTYADLEVVVSDNGSTDDTQVVLSRLGDERVSIVRHVKNKGMVHNWNSCLSWATGDFFLLLSDDDILEESAIANLMTGFSSESVSLSYGPVRNVLESGVFAQTKNLAAPRVESGEQFFSNAVKGRRAAFPSASMFRTSEARKVGGYPDIGTATDFALHLTLAMMGSVAFCPMPIARYRVHPGSQSFSDESILSQVRLLDWINSAHPSLGRYRAELARYSAGMVFGWGRFHALRGHRREARHARSVLQTIAPKSPLRLWLRLFDLPPFRRAAQFRRWLKGHLRRGN